jgi:PPOX class probable FMN-dependent enzyme
VNARPAPLADEAALREIYNPPNGFAAAKEIDHLDEMCRRFIACSPVVFVASASAEGRCDVTPRGGPPGFVTVLDRERLAIPDATGNRRIDTLRNITETGRAALIFLIPGRRQTLRVNGRAVVSADSDLLASLTAVGKPPKTAIVVEAEEVFAHCPKAFVRSAVWDPETWLPPEAQPSQAEVTHAHLGDPNVTIEDVERSQEEALRTRLA